MVKKAKAGDKEILEEIIERLQPLLISSIKRYYNKPKEYEDLMQEGNLKIIQSINDYDKDKGVHFLGYIKFNIKYLYLDKHKQRFHQSLNQQVGDGETEMMDLLVGEEVDFLEGIIRDENRIKLKEALDLLTPRQRQVIELYYGRNMSMADIANNLGVTYRTVVNTKTRALEKMRKTYPPYYPSEV